MLQKIIFTTLLLLTTLQAELQQQHLNLLTQKNKDIANHHHRTQKQQSLSYSIYEAPQSFSFYTDSKDLCIVTVGHNGKDTTYDITMCSAKQKAHFTVMVTINHVSLQRVKASDTFSILATLEEYKTAFRVCTAQRQSLLPAMQMFMHSWKQGSTQDRGYKKVKIDWHVTKNSLVQLIKIKKGKKYQVISGYNETKSKSNNIVSWRVSDQIVDGAFLKISVSAKFWGKDFWIAGTATILCKEIPATRSVPVKNVFPTYAPPLQWGIWLTAASHLGVTTYQIDYEVLGDTMVYAEVSYYNKQGFQQHMFLGTTIIHVDGVANVKVRFHGVPLGSMIQVRVR